MWKASSGSEREAHIEILFQSLLYRGKTKILTKTKEIREQINHKTNENRAYEIVKFHKGYVFGEPIQYIRRERAADNVADDEIATEINALNGYKADANKSACDNSNKKHPFFLLSLTFPLKCYTIELKKNYRLTSEEI